MSIFRKRCVFQYIYEDFIFILKTTLSSRRNLTTDEQSKIWQHICLNYSCVKLHSYKQHREDISTIRKRAATKWIFDSFDLYLKELTTEQLKFLVATVWWVWWWSKELTFFLKTVRPCCNLAHSIDRIERIDRTGRSDLLKRLAKTWKTHHPVYQSHKWTKLTSVGWRVSDIAGPKPSYFLSTFGRIETATESCGMQQPNFRQTTEVGLIKVVWRNRYMYRVKILLDIKCTKFFDRQTRKTVVLSVLY